MSVGVHEKTRRYSPGEVAEAFQTARAAGATLEECAEAVHLDGTSMVTRFLRLLNLDPTVRHIADWGRTPTTIAFTAASELARLAGADVQREASAAILEYRLNTDEVRQLVQLRMRTRNSITVCVRDVLKMRPVIERRHVLICSVLAALRPQLGRLVQVDRDRLLREAIERLFPEMAGFGCRLGVETFWIVGDDKTAELVRKTADYEDAINQELKRVLR